MNITPTLFSHWTRPVPRYTSYPTALQFHALEPSALVQHLRLFDATDKPLSLYIHVPFCKTMCLFCACSVVLNRSPERQATYLATLLQEIALTVSHFSRKRKVTQLHLGGGTPTSLTELEMHELMETLRRHFEFAEDAEIAIEVDPRTVFGDQGAKLRALRQMGFTRVSFGVQDLDPAVQEAVRRRQSREMTVETYHLAKELGFQSVNIDLIYGLPLQTTASFRKTVEELIRLQPDRIALFSYAKVPWLKKHQQAIRDEDLPSAQEKFQIYTEARELFLQAKYVAIGMDHFAKQGDSLAIAYKGKKLTRNFQGYAVQSAEDVLGFGVTAIGFLEGAYFQNAKTIDEYQSRLSHGELPLFRGIVLQKEDHLRRFVIQEIMCRFSIDKLQFATLFGEPFDLHFAKEEPEIARLIEEGLLEQTPQELKATPTGELFIRLIASVFDQHMGSQSGFSSSV
jgi:oxygen-independent coproporphyrinogen-3 oxidase